MKVRLTFWAVSTLGAIFLMRPAQAQVIGGTVSLDAPQDGATLNSTVSIQATLTPEKGWTATKAFAKIMSSNGYTTTYDMTRVGAGDQFQFRWDTMSVRNTNYYLSVHGIFATKNAIPPNMATLSEIPSATREFTVNNGYKIVRDKTKSFAEVILPIEGQVIPRNGEFTIETRHQLTYERFDAQGTYIVRHRLFNQNPYGKNPNRSYSASDIDPKSHWTQLPNRVGEFVVDSVVLTADYVHTENEAFGLFGVTAFTWAEADRGGVFMELGHSNFSTSR
jgi:hypothetical protein